MTTRMKTVLATSVALATAAGTAQAADTGFFFGAGVGQTTVEFQETLDDGLGGFADYHFDKDETGWKILAGYDFLPFLGVEVDYYDFGSPNDNQNLGGIFGNVNAEIDVTGWGLYAVGTLPIGPVDLFVKGGGASIEADGKLSGPLGSVHFNESDEYFAYGAGVAMNFGNFGVRAEYEGFDVDIDDLYFISLSATYHL